MVKSKQLRRKLIWLLIGSFFIFLSVIFLFYKSKLNQSSPQKLYNPTRFQLTNFKAFDERTPSSDWSTYNPEISNVVMKYPSDKWERKEVMGFDILRLKAPRADNKLVWIVSGPNGAVSFDDSLKKTDGVYHLSRYSTTMEPEFIVIDGHKAILFETPYGIEVTFFDGNGMSTYYVHFNAESEHNFKDFKNDFLEVLSTAKFQ